MTQYIDKDALVAEIYKLRDFANDHWDIEEVNGVDKFLDRLILYINNLEVKEEIKIGETKIYLTYDGKQWIDLGCTEHEIPIDKFKDGDTVELIIRKVQKGE